MKLQLTTLTALVLLGSANLASANCPEVLDFEMRKLRSKDTVQLCEAYAGQPLLVINTASHCGFTPQFKGLEALYKEYQGRGLHVAGFPSNSFKQEANTEEKTAEICYINYGVTFDMYSEIDVTGSDAHPMFAQLAEAEGAPRWNFTKYLIDADGNVVAKFGSRTAPENEDFRAAIEAVLTN